MSGETEQNVSGWTTDTLKHHFDQRFVDVEKQTTLALAASEKAVSKAETAAERRFEGINEFRAALNDASVNNITRAEAEAQFTNLREKLLDTGTRLERLEAGGTGRADGSRQVQALVFAIIGAMVGLTGVIISIVVVANS